YSWARPAVRRAYELLRVPADNGRGIQSSLTRLAGRHL
ncbi:dimethyladenosine transferase, partial [Xanthomonas citri pv. citri]|nr:dimethyladenosine transferase [Xanthomonas citri pv. citri]